MRTDDTAVRTTREERDRLALEEIDLYSELLIAAGGTDRPLSGDEIDQALGLHAA